MAGCTCPVKRISPASETPLQWIFMHTADLFAAIESSGPSRETMAEGAVLLRGRALPLRTQADCGSPDHRDAVAVPAHGDAGRLRDVGRDDQLRRGRLGHRSDRSSLRPQDRKPASWGLTPSGFRFCASRPRPPPKRAIKKFSAGRLPDQPLTSRAPGPSLHQDRNERDFAKPIVSGRSGCRPSSSSAAGSAPMRSPNMPFAMATSPSGAARRASFTTASPRSRTASSRSSGACGST